jgi:hypothetical protein
MRSIRFSPLAMARFGLEEQALWTRCVTAKYLPFRLEKVSLGIK